jgi:hypothetical protein
MEHNPPEEADTSSSSQYISRILWNTNVHYTVHKCRPYVHFLKRVKVRPTFSTNNFKIHSNIILIPLPRSSRWPLSSIFPPPETYMYFLVEDILLYLYF